MGIPARLTAERRAESTTVVISGSLASVAIFAGAAACRRSVVIGISATV
jgi:hypothetical protein